MTEADDLARLRLEGLMELARTHTRAGDYNSLRIIMQHAEAEFGPMAPTVITRALKYSPSEWQRAGEIQQAARQAQQSAEFEAALQRGEHERRERWLDVLWDRACAGHNPARRELMRMASVSAFSAGKAVDVMEASWRLDSWEAARDDVGAGVQDVVRAKRLLEGVQWSRYRNRRTTKVTIEMTKASKWLRANRSEPEHLVEEDAALERLGP